MLTSPPTLHQHDLALAAAVAFTEADKPQLVERHSFGIVGGIAIAVVLQRKKFNQPSVFQPDARSVAAASFTPLAWERLTKMSRASLSCSTCFDCGLISLCSYDVDVDVGIKKGDATKRQRNNNMLPLWNSLAAQGALPASVHPVRLSLRETFYLSDFASPVTARQRVL
jgi:hypothetical protein